MTLSYNLFKNLTQKLKLTELQNKKSYIKNLGNQIEKLEYNNKNHKNLDTTIYRNLFFQQDLTVYYIINISFLKRNTVIHLLDANGKSKMGFSSGTIGFKGKQRSNRKLTATKLIAKLSQKATFINRKPVAVHLNDVKFYRRLILKKLKQNFFIKVVKSFNSVPFNGCRKRKIRRKKYTKILK